MNTVGKFGSVRLRIIGAELLQPSVVSHSIWLVIHQRPGTRWSPIIFTWRLEARITDSLSCPFSSCAQSQGYRYHGQRRPEETWLLGSSSRCCTVPGSEESLGVVRIGLRSGRPKLPPPELLTLRSFEEGLGRVMYVAGALEYEWPLLGPSPQVHVTSPA